MFAHAGRFPHVLFGQHGPFGGRGPWHSPWGDFESWFSDRDRMERGDLRLLLLGLLREGPRHGYDLIKELGERSGGRYTPSAGAVYPTLQLLEDQGLVRSEAADQKRVYAITEAGRQYLAAHEAELQSIWTRLRGDRPGPELRLLFEEIADLMSLLIRARARGLHRDAEKVRRVREVFERARREIRQILLDETEIV